MELYGPADSSPSEVFAPIFEVGRGGWGGRHRGGNRHLAPRGPHSSWRENGKRRADCGAFSCAVLECNIDRASSLDPEALGFSSSNTVECVVRALAQAWRGVPGFATRRREIVKGGR